jgi:uncharacterized membrane protein required for colicin V production
MNILLVVVGAIFLVGIIIGYARGFLKIAISLAAYAVAILLVATLSPHVSSWIQQSTPLVEMVQNKVNKTLLQAGQSEEELSHVEESQQEQIALVENGNVPEFIQNMLLANNNNEVYQVLGVTTFVDYIGAYIAKLIADILSFIILIIVAIIAVHIILGVAGIIGKIPVIGGINRLAGGAVGMIVALLIVWILFAVITLLYNTSLGAKCLQDIADSKILTVLYEKNFLMNRITRF